MKPHGPWKIVRSYDIYADPWVHIRKDDVLRPDGKPGIHTVISLKAGVTVLALDRDENVILTEEFHYGVGRITLEGVSGGREGDEDPLVTAQRELREELGFEAAQWTNLGPVDPFTTNVVSPTQLFLAEKLTVVGSDPEGTELIRPVRMPLAEAVEMVMSGEISHAPSGLVILKTWWRRNANVV